MLSEYRTIPYASPGDDAPQVDTFGPASTTQRVPPSLWDRDRAVRITPAGTTILTVCRSSLFRTYDEGDQWRDERR